jgi:ABC-2 type transport system permease protein
MNSFLATTGILFRAHLVRTLRTRRCLVAVLLCALPVGMSTLIATVSRFEGPPPIGLLHGVVWHLTVQILTPLVALIFGSAVIAEEIEDRTITYLFTRPIQRQAILLGRWLAALVPMLVALGLSSGIVLRLLGGLGSEETGHGDWMPEGFRWRAMVVVLSGAAVYSALFAAAGALFKRPILIGLAYTFVYELILGNLPGSNQKATVQYYLKSFLLAGDVQALKRFEESIAIVPLAEPAAAARMLALILVGALALGAWRLSRREYVLAA